MSALFVTGLDHTLRTDEPGVPASEVMAAVVLMKGVYDPQYGAFELAQAQLYKLVGVVGLLLNELPAERQLEILNTISHGWKEAE